MLMPMASTISGSSTPARISAPSRVLLRSSHSAANTSRPRTRTKMRYLGYITPPIHMAPLSASGTGTENVSPPQITSEMSLRMKATPSVSSTWRNSKAAHEAQQARSSTAPSAATSAIAANAPTTKLPLAFAARITGEAAEPNRALRGRD